MDDLHKSFQRNLTEVLKYDEEESRKITALAKKKYRELIERLIVTAAIRKSRPLIWGSFMMSRLKSASGTLPA